MSLMVLHISLILLKLIGSKDLFQFCLISLAIGLHFLTASLELSLLLLCEALGASCHHVAAEW